jgi:AcrR family transcriptional regulator
MELATQDKILGAAAECFGRWGYKKTSIDAVAERAGVAKGTVYLYCESKEDLFYQSVHRELRQWIADLSKLIDRRRRADEIMMRLAAADLEFVERHPLVRDLLFGLFHGLLPDWADKLEELRALGLRHVVELIELGIRQGVFATDIDVEATARVLQEMQLAGVLLGHRTNRSLAEVRRQQLAAARLVMDGLRTH